MNLKKLKIMGVVIAFLLAFLFHYLYNIFPCLLTSIIAPVNESIFEHMKILFGSILLSGIIQKIIVKAKHFNYNNVCFSNFIASITSIPIFLLIYLPVYYIIGENLCITIIIMLIIIVISQVLTIKIIKSKNLHLENFTIIFVLITYLAFGILTYNPPKYPLFMDPITLNYGIKKE